MIVANFGEAVAIDHRGRGILPGSDITVISYCRGLSSWHRACHHHIRRSAASSPSSSSRDGANWERHPSPHHDGCSGGSAWGEHGPAGVWG